MDSTASKSWITFKTRDDNRHRGHSRSYPEREVKRVGGCHGAVPWRGMNIVVAASPKGGERAAGITLVTCAHVRRKRGSLESSLDSTRICDPLAIEAGKAVCKSLRRDILLEPNRSYGPVPRGYRLILPLPF